MYVSENTELRALTVRATKSDFFTPKENEVLQTCLQNKSYTVEAMKHLSNYLQSLGGDVKLHDIVRNGPSRLLFPNNNKEVSKPSAQLLRRRAQLTRLQQTKEYNMMVHGKTTLSTTEEAIDASFASAKKQAATSSNVVVSMIAMFGIFYYVGKQFSPNPTHCLLFGLGGALLIMIVEMLLFIIRESKMEMKKISAMKASQKSFNITQQ